MLYTYTRVVLAATISAAMFFTATQAFARELCHRDTKAYDAIAERRVSNLGKNIPLSLFEIVEDECKAKLAVARQDYQRDKERFIDHCLQLDCPDIEFEPEELADCSKVTFECDNSSGGSSLSCHIHSESINDPVGTCYRVERGVDLTD